MQVSEDMWEVMQQHLGYSDEEMAVFREEPRNEDVVSKAPAMMDKTIIARVVESHGCNSRHKVGDEFVFDGAGNLISKLCPKRICVFALKSMATSIFAMNELFYAGVDANEMRFKRAGCFDVGVRCGGWGHIVFEMRMEDRVRPSA
ncbi:MAG: TIGR04076 family protein [Actinobacteria bacterium]|nr:TIGR04076 family protein [Actinomycetota bacterium]